MENNDQDTVERAYKEFGPDFGLASLVRQEAQNREDIGRFCNKFKIRLLKIDYTTENDRLELMYFFNDNLGGYTIEAIRGSLEPEKVGGL